VLLDMDGTLLSSTAAVERCWRTLAREHGVPARDIVDLLLADRSADERAAALDRVVELEIADTEGITVLPGAAEALAALVPAGRCAIVTSCGRRLAEARYGASGLPWPEVVITADDVTRGKPDPEPYVLGARRLGVPVDRCLVVEDAPSGVRSGRAAGAVTLGLRTTGPGPGADVEITDLSEARFRIQDRRVRVERARAHS
jgi:sugar-phosphatase